MKLILSRKGFDSSSGGVPSPIFPDGRMLSLPIPEQDEWAEASYRITYEQLRWPGEPIGDLVEQLTRRSVSREHRAHIDPDIFAGSLARGTGWRPIFGQSDAAQAHLKNKKQNVGPGDIFLFFGLFRNVETKDSVLRFASSCPQQHVIFGWLQVDRAVQVDSCRENMPWAHYHPHLHCDYPHNTLYIASENLTLPSGDTGRPGAGVFDRYSCTLRLTAPGESASRWLLPAWFAPNDQKPPLTYHSRCNRWGPITEEGVLLRSVSPGQEFVLDCDAYPEAHGWLAELFHNAPLTRPSGNRGLSTS